MAKSSCLLLSYKVRVALICKAHSLPVLQPFCQRQLSCLISRPQAMLAPVSHTTRFELCRETRDTVRRPLPS